MENIIENSIMCGGDIVARALELLATMVQILEENSAESLSDCQADYLSSTLSDLRCIRFDVSWLIPCVEKAVKQYKSKPLLDSLNNLSQLISQVKERKAILLDEVAILREEENKLMDVTVKVSKTIPFSGEVKFDELVGSGLTYVFDYQPVTLVEVLGTCCFSRFFFFRWRSKIWIVFLVMYSMNQTKLLTISSRSPPMCMCILT
ncbi:hypothetical protein RND81_14G172500 [Saponaria officinalis]|uniref:Uncharacterized protein n=1 Tax=Saponaria officinalis TaxID=3572 RepID=A0AAW1GYW8_SAPOF